MSFIGSMFSNTNGSGFQAQGQDTDQNLINQASNGLNSVNGQLSAQANGQGAVQQATQAQLQQATNQGISNAAGVAASTKGTNPAMAARLAANNAAQSQQTAANQSAALTAQNAMNSQAQLSNNLQSQLNTGQSGLNATNAANVQIAQGNQQAQQGAFSGAVNSVSSILGLAKGGMVRNYAEGGPTLGVDTDLSASGPAPVSSDGPTLGVNTTLPAAPTVAQMFAGGDNNLGKAPASSGPSQGIQMGKSGGGDNSMYQGFASIGQNFGPNKAMSNVEGLGGILGAFLNEGGAVKPVKAMLSPGEKYIPPKGVDAIKKGADPMAVGKTVPGKAKVKGAKNSLKNDTVPATLEEGGIVLPRSVTQSKDPHKAAYKFVDSVLAKQNIRKGPKK